MLVFHLVPPVHRLLQLKLQLVNLLNLPLPAVLGGHLVLASPSDVPTHIELLLRQLILTQQVIELIHGKTHKSLTERKVTKTVLINFPSL